MLTGHLEDHSDHETDHDPLPNEDLTDHDYSTSKNNSQKQNEQIQINLTNELGQSKPFDSES